MMGGEGGCCWEYVCRVWGRTACFPESCTLSEEVYGAYGMSAALLVIWDEKNAQHVFLFDFAIYVFYKGHCFSCLANQESKLYSKYSDYLYLLFIPWKYCLL